MNNKLPQNHSHLIQEISQDLKPKKAVSTKKLIIISFLFSLAFLAMNIWMVGPSRALDKLIQTPSFILTALSLLILGWGAMVLAIKISTPGEKLHPILKYTIPSVPLILAIGITIDIVSHMGWQPYLHSWQGGASCFGTTVAYAILPILFFTVISMKLAPLYPFYTALLISISSLSLSSFGLQWHCFSQRSCHMALWHYIPIFFVSFLLSYPLQVLLSQWKKSKS